MLLAAGKCNAIYCSGLLTNASLVEPIIIFFCWNCDSKVLIYILIYVSVLFICWPYKFFWYVSFFCVFIFRVRRQNEISHCILSHPMSLVRQNFWRKLCLNLTVKFQYPSTFQSTLLSHSAVSNPSIAVKLWDSFPTDNDTKCVPRPAIRGWGGEPEDAAVRDDSGAAEGV